MLDFFQRSIHNEKEKCSCFKGKQRAEYTTLLQNQWSASTLIP